MFKRFGSGLLGFVVAVSATLFVGQAAASEDDTLHVPKESEAAVILTDEHGEPVGAICKPGEEYNVWGPPLFIVDDESAGFESSLRAKDVFLEEIRRDASPRNPALKELPPEVRSAYEDYFAKYFAPAQKVDASEVFVFEAEDRTIYAHGIADNHDFSALEWSSVRIEVAKTEHGRFYVSDAVICGRQLYDERALEDQIDFSKFPSFEEKAEVSR